MTKELTEIVLKITSELSSLNTNMRSVLDKLTSHEQRILQLEQGKGNLKDNIVKWLVIALIGSVSVIVTLTGSGALLKQLMGLM